MSGTRRTVLAIVLGLASGCGGHEHGDHGHDNDADEGHGGAEVEVEPIAITRWTDDYELFVELPPPAPKKPVPYHAHVTRLSDFGAVTEGVFRVRFKNARGVAAEGVQQGVKRPGIFVFESPAPAAGEYALEMSYEHAGKVDVFDCGTITVADKPPPAAEESAVADHVPERVAVEDPVRDGVGREAADRKRARAAGDGRARRQRSAHDRRADDRPLLPQSQARARRGLARQEGRRDRHHRAHGRRRRLQPSAARRRRSAARARNKCSGRSQRVEPLVKQGLLPERRLVELRNELATESAKLSSASGRVGRVVTPGGAGALTIRSTLDGVVSQVLVPERRAGGGRRGARAARRHRPPVDASRFVAKPATDLEQCAAAQRAAARRRRRSSSRSSARAFCRRCPSSIPRRASRPGSWISFAPADATSDAAPRACAWARAWSSPSVSARRRRCSPCRAGRSSRSTRARTCSCRSTASTSRSAPSPSGQADGPWVAITSGVEEGERVVTRGGFDIHLAALMGTSSPTATEETAMFDAIIRGSLHTSRARDRGRGAARRRRPVRGLAHAARRAAGALRAFRHRRDRSERHGARGGRASGHRAARASA